MALGPYRGKTVIATWVNGQTPHLRTIVQILIAGPKRWLSADFLRTHVIVVRQVGDSGRSVTYGGCRPFMLDSAAQFQNHSEMKKQVKAVFTLNVGIAMCRERSGIPIDFLIKGYFSGRLT